jgi:GT2 family glycosyltransferase
MKVEIISATRKSAADFRDDSALGISLQRLAHDRQLVPRIATANARGLPDVYNASLDAAAGDSIVVFMHDDVWIDDHFFSQRIAEGLERFDVIGVAGNRRRISGQPAWLFVDPKFTWDQRENLTGSIGHGQHPCGSITCFGAAPAACELIDGVFLAARKSVLEDNEISFDPRFDFHFYDMDFCRVARQRGLKLGTWPICLTHQSTGGFASESWRKGYNLYLSKWGA